VQDWMKVQEVVTSGNGFVDLMPYMYRYLNYDRFDNKTRN